MSSVSAANSVAIPPPKSPKQVTTDRPLEEDNEDHGYESSGSNSSDSDSRSSRSYSSDSSCYVKTPDRPMPKSVSRSRSWSRSDSGDSGDDKEEEEASTNQKREPIERRVDRIRPRIVPEVYCHQESLEDGQIESDATTRSWTRNQSREHTTTTKRSRTPEKRQAPYPNERSNSRHSYDRRDVRRTERPSYPRSPSRSPLRYFF